MAKWESSAGLTLPVSTDGGMDHQRWFLLVLVSLIGVFLSILDAGIVTGWNTPAAPASA